jgi:hypothetical protein
MNLLHITFTEGLFFRNLCEIFHNFFKILHIEVHPQGGLRSRMINSNGTILFDVHLPLSGFQTFHATRPMSFGINIRNFYDIFIVKRKDRIEMLIEEANPHVLIVRIHPVNSGYTDEIAFTLQDIQVFDIQLPTGYVQPSVEGPSNKFQQMCKQMKKINKEICISKTSDTIIFSGETSGIYTKRTTFGDGTDLTPIFSQWYDLEQFVKISKLSTFHSTIQFTLSPDLPMIIQTQIGNLGTISVFIKPKLSSQFQAPP